MICCCPTVGSTPTGNSTLGEGKGEGNGAGEERGEEERKRATTLDGTDGPIVGKVDGGMGGCVSFIRVVVYVLVLFFCSLLSAQSVAS